MRDNVHARVYNAHQEIVKIENIERTSKIFKMFRATSLGMSADQSIQVSIQSLHRRLLMLEKINGKYDALVIHSESDDDDDSVLSPSLVKKQPVIRVLLVPPRTWTRLDTLPAQNEYFDKKTRTLMHEDWILSLKIKYINMERKQTTSVHTRQGDRCQAPTGVHVFENRSIEFSPRFFSELEGLYAATPADVLRDRGDDGRASNLIFHSSKHIDSPSNYGMNIEILKNHAPEVGRIMETYAHGVREALHASDSQLRECSMSIIRYDVGCGIRQHIDNIAGSLGFEVGPLVSIAVGQGEKYLDMLPTVTNDRSLKPVRITVNQGDVIVMDGPSRLEWSHSVPFGHSHVMYSLLLKFKTLDKIPAYKNSFLGEMMYCSIDP